MIQAVVFNLESTFLDPGGRGLIQGMLDILRWKGVQVTEDQVSHGDAEPYFHTYTVAQFAGLHGISL